MRQLRPALETSPVEEILARLEDLATIFRHSAGEGERLARLPKQVVRALVQHGLFRLWVPKNCAGFELDLPEALEVFEAAARLDGSIGWAVMIGSYGGLFAAYLDACNGELHLCPARGGGRRIGCVPDGRAMRVRGGYRVSGCWHYATGAHYATAFTANCIVMEGGTLAFRRRRQAARSRDGFRQPPRLRSCRCGIRAGCAAPAVMISKCATCSCRRIAASRCLLNPRRASRVLCTGCR